MPFIYSFCTWFSVRMGSIIVAITTLVQAVVLLILCLIAVKDEKSLFFRLELIKTENDLMFAEPYITYIQHNINHCSTIATGFFLISIACCLLLIHGSYTLTIWEIIPFIIVEFIRLIVLSISTASLMLLIKRNVLDFNILIVCLVSSVFMLLLLYYFWLCPVSLIQCIQKVSKKERSIKATSEIGKNDMTNMYDFLSEFTLKPTMPNRSYYQYQYGNLPNVYF